MLKKLTVLFLILCLTVSCFCGCDGNVATTEPSGETNSAPAENVDYAGQLKLDHSSGAVYQEVTVKQFIDGDTTHFFVPSSVAPNGVLKARYLAVNTPESTGVIEEYGKKASNFTKEKLKGAQSIIIESDTATWDADSTGDRYLCWIWYRNSEAEDYRCLNLELLQNGLAIASSSSNNRYGEICMKALNQAKAQKLNVHSGEKDPDFYYGEAVELTLKELRTNIEEYANVRVAFNGIVTMNDNNSVYVEDYDAETDMYYGMSVYYGFNLNGQGLDILDVGNEVRIVGSVQYYEAGGTWQVADLKYRLMKPDDPNNIQMLSSGNSPSYRPMDPYNLIYGKVDVEKGEEVVSMPYAQLSLSTSVEMKNLLVTSIYTTNSDTASNGAMTLTCLADGYTVSVRTTVLLDDDGNVITADAYRGKTIDVKGIVDYYNGTYQIKVFSDDSITVH